MKYWNIFISLFLLASCAVSKKQRAALLQENNAQVYAYRDVSGEFEFAREVKFEKAKLATRVQMLAGSGGGERLLEKTFAVSAVGSVKTRNGRATAIRPELSQHTVWLEGKKYFSQLKLNSKRRVLEAILESPEGKWQGSREVKIPSGRVFCFYSQLPECLVMSGLLNAATDSRRRLTFVMVWDSWPYHQEHFTGLRESPFANATVSFEGKQKTEQRYNVEVSGQAMSLHFSRAQAFVRMFWTTQGISLLPPGENQISEEM